MLGSTEPQPSSPPVVAGELVEARDVANPTTNPFTYPAWVLSVHGPWLHVIYVADGLTADTVNAFVTASVAASEVRIASERERQRCQLGLEYIVLEYIARAVWPPTSLETVAGLPQLELGHALGVGVGK